MCFCVDRDLWWIVSFFSDNVFCIDRDFMMDSDNVFLC